MSRLDEDREITVRNPLFCSPYNKDWKAKQHHRVLIWEEILTMSHS